MTMIEKSPSTLTITICDTAAARSQTVTQLSMMGATVLKVYETRQLLVNDATAEIGRRDKTCWAVVSYS